MKKNRNLKQVRYVISFVILALLLFALLLVNVNNGSVDLNITKIVEILLFKDKTDITSYHIIWDIRLPRIIAAIFLGGALSISGFLLQTFFNNPIAGPFVLGISSGAKLFVSLVMIIFIGSGNAPGSAMMILAAFSGSIISMMFILAVSRKVRRMSMLVICGVMIGYICSAITDFIITFADDSNIVNLHNWSMGSFSGTNWDNVTIIFIVVTVAVLITFFMSKPIGAYQMGEQYASNMGVNIKVFRVILILLSSVLSACVTAFAGPVSFVGIAVPHLMKSLLKTAKPVLLIPACFLGGAVFCVFCDFVARTAFAPTEVSISSVTAIFGAPVVIYMMIKRHKEKE